MKKELLKAIYGSDKTALKLGNIQIPCYVLEDGTRVFSGRGIQKALGSSASSGAWLNKFVTNSPITEYLETGVLDKLNNPIRFKRNDAGGSQSSTYGHEVTILIDICDSILEAKKTGKTIDDNIVFNAELIIRSVAKVGIIALVDEATGYQEVRDKDDLQKFLQKFLDEEKGKWIKTFPDEFFEAIFKMKGWTWTIANNGKKPQVVGHYINDFVYSRIAPQVLSDLKTLNPKNENGKRKGKHSQWINQDFGHPMLKQHINILTAFAKASGYNWNNWKRLVERALPKFNIDGSQSQELPLPD